jgi:hypothetical protein
MVCGPKVKGIANVRGDVYRPRLRRSGDGACLEPSCVHLTVRGPERTAIRSECHHSDDMVREHTAARSNAVAPIRCAARVTDEVHGAIGVQCDAGAFAAAQIAGYWCRC